MDGSLPIRSGSNAQGNEHWSIESRAPELSVVFKKARDDFLDSLSEEDRRRFRPFDNPTDMVADLVNRCSCFTERNRLLTGCKAINKFAKFWVPYFGIIDLCLQLGLSGQAAATAWGAVRLVFLVSVLAVTSAVQYQILTLKN